MFGSCLREDGAWFNAGIYAGTDAGDVDELMHVVIEETALTAEGITAITYYARDVQGNQEVPRTLTVRIDKTAPTISGSRRSSSPSSKTRPKTLW